MSTKRKVEIFSAVCPACEPVVPLVKSIACPSCEIEVLDMHDDAVASRTKEHGVRSVPAIVVNGKLVDCCVTPGIDEATLRAAGVGVPLPV